MKQLYLTLIVWMCIISGSAAQTPGIYQGYVSVKRTNPLLRINDVTTLLIRGEYYLDTLTSRPAIIWTPTSADTMSKMANAWCRLTLPSIIAPGYSMPTMSLYETDIQIPGGKIESFKVTANSITWKTTYNGGPSRRPTMVTTTFYFSRIGPLPDPN